MNVVAFGWDLSWEQFEMVYRVLHRTVLLFQLPVCLFYIKICISEKGCKINDSIDLDHVRAL